MPVFPSFLERILFVRLNQGPAPLMDIVAAAGYHVVAIADKLGVFERLQAGRPTAAELARHVNANERATRALLEALQAFGYVRAHNGRYRVTGATTKWLLRTSRTSIADYIRFWDELVFKFFDAHFEEVLRQGKPPFTFYDWLNDQPDGWPRMEAAFAAADSVLAGQIVERVKLPAKVRRLLDLGGGHGLFSVMFCRRYPNLSATIFDLPSALQTTGSRIRTEGLEDRILLQSGDFWRDELGTGYDVALLFNIIHAYVPRRTTELFRRVAGALNPGGQVVIYDQFRSQRGGSFLRASDAFWDLTFLTLLGGQTYSLKEVSASLEAAGFGRPRVLKLLTFPIVVVATKPS